MQVAHILKPVLVAAWVVGGFMLLAPDSPTGAAEPAQTRAAAVDVSKHSPDEYAGSESCKTCHEDQYVSFARTAHADMAHSRFETDMSRGCEACHGPSKKHVECETERRKAMEAGEDVADCDKSLVVSYRSQSPKDVSSTCLSCHAGLGEEHSNYIRGEHWRNDVGCTDCHDPHGTALHKDRLGSQTYLSPATEHKIDFGVQAMLKESEPAVCFRCHSEQKAQFTMPFRHRVLEGELRCSDCHNPHGGFELRQARLATGADAVCVKCHNDKQGPFTFEHAPLKTEGCASCHTPHGSANPRLLRRADVFQLCIECHTEAHGIGAPNTPSFHNLAQEKWRNCTTCHVMIHGSMSHPLYFR
jgi:predicted CXXCH cytochrome family protein